MRKKRWSPELERKVKDVVSISKNKDEAYRGLLKEGFSVDEIERVLQRFYKLPRNGIAAANTNQNASSSDPTRQIQLSPHEQQLELIAFSQNVRGFISMNIFEPSIYLYPYFFSDPHVESRCS